MNLTDFHAKYFAHEPTKRSPSDSVELLAGILAIALVYLNPHRIEAALFAFGNIPTMAANNAVARAARRGGWPTRARQEPLMIALEMVYTPIKVQKKETN